MRRRIRGLFRKPGFGNERIAAPTVSLENGSRVRDMCARYCNLDIERMISWEEVSPWRFRAGLLRAILPAVSEVVALLLTAFNSELCVGSMNYMRSAMV